jgi:hypothetical protein
MTIINDLKPITYTCVVDEQQHLLLYDADINLWVIMRVVNEGTYLLNKANLKFYDIAKNSITDKYLRFIEFNECVDCFNKYIK